MFADSASPSRSGRLPGAAVRPLLFASLSILLFALAAIPQTASAQEDLSTFLDSVEVNLVNVEVFVTDRQGRRVDGLTRDDFVVEVDGQPVEVSNFFVAQAAAPGTGSVAELPTRTASPEALVAPGAHVEAPGEVAPTGDTPRRPMFLTVYVDNVNLTPGSRKRVLAALRPVVLDRVAAGDQVMLVSYNRSVEVLQTFTRDATALEAALAELEDQPTRRQEANMQLRQVLSPISEDPETGLPEQVLVDNYQQIREVEALAAYKGLRQAIIGLSGIPGRKALLYVSEGIPRYPGAELDQVTESELTAARAELPGQRSRRDLRPFYRDLFRQANAHEVTLYTLDARGPSENFLLSAESQAVAGSMVNFTFYREANLQEPILELADQTGGQAILNTLNFGEMLENVTRDFQSYYSLGFPAPESDDEYHDVEVRVKGKGLQVRHREGYLAKSTAARVADRTESFLLQGWQSNPMGVELQFGAPEKKRRKWQVPVLVRVPASAITLLPRDGEMAGQLELFVAVRDGEGRASELTRLQREIRISNADLEQQAAEGLRDLGYAVQLEMRPGPQSLVVGVWDQVGGGESYVYQKVVVGGPS